MSGAANGAAERITRIRPWIDEQVQDFTGEELLELARVVETHVAESLGAPVWAPVVASDEAPFRARLGGDGRFHAPVTNPSRTLAFRSAGEIVAAGGEDVPWLVHGLIALGSLGLLVSAPKAGKTELILGLLAALVKGGKFAGREVRRSRVVLLAEERPATVTPRLERWGLDAAEEIRVLLRSDAFGVGWRDVVLAAVTEAKRTGAELLIVDTLGEWAGFRGEEENSAGAALAALEPLQQAASEGLAVLVAHHARKSGGAHGAGIRGSSALAGAVDVLLELDRSKDGSRCRRILRGLGRFAETPEELVLELAHGEYRLVGESAAAIQAEAGDARIRGALGDGGRTAAEIATELGMSDRTMRRKLDGLSKEDTVRRDGSGTPRDPYRYFPVRSPRTNLGFGDGDRTEAGR